MTSQALQTAPVQPERSLVPKTVSTAPAGPVPAPSEEEGEDSDEGGEPDRTMLESLPKSLWRRYLLSLFIMLAALAAMLLLGNVSLKMQAEDAARITSSARIRNAVQRIVAIAPIDAPSVADEIAVHHDRLRQALDFVDGSIGPEMQAVLDEPVGDVTLLQALHEFDRAITAGQAATVAAVPFWAGDEAAERMERLADAAGRDARSRSQRMAWIQIGLLGLTLVVIAFNTLLVFRPGNRAIAMALEALLDRTARLERARADIAAQNRRLDRALGEAEALRREQSEFTYAMSHDLKSPANTIGLLLAEIAEDPGNQMTTDSGEFMSMARSTVERMRNLVDSVLDYSRATGRERQRVAVSLEQSLSEAMADLRADIARRNAKVTIATPLPTVQGDPVQIRLLMQNLISNAIKFTAPDKTPEITISASGPDRDGRLKISVADNGIGIAEEDQERIFGLFQRLHLRDDFPGSGIGLTLCKRIVANHSGEIQVRSTPGAGSTFDVTLFEKAA